MVFTREIFSFIRSIFSMFSVIKRGINLHDSSFMHAQKSSKRIYECILFIKIFLANNLRKIIPFVGLSKLQRHFWKALIIIEGVPC